MTGETDAQSGNDQEPMNTAGAAHHFISKKKKMVEIKVCEAGSS